MSINYMCLPGVRPSIATSKEVQFETITKMVCKITEQDPKNLQLKTRKREIVFSRQVCMSLAKLKTKHSLSTIGKYYGGKDHATVLHAIKTIKNLIDTDKTIREDIGHLFIGVKWPNYKNTVK